MEESLQLTNRMINAFLRSRQLSRKLVDKIHVVIPVRYGANSVEWHDKVINKGSYERYKIRYPQMQIIRELKGYEDD